MNVRVRIGPSPTGRPHIGTAYVALFNYAFAKQTAGKFVLRIEDTDLKRSSKKSELEIIESLKWLGVSWDEGPDIGGNYGPYRQSERLNVYKTHISLLLDNKNAYWCKCTTERLLNLKNQQMITGKTPGYDGRCRELNLPSGLVVRLKVPTGNELTFADLLRGEIKIKTSNIDDQILFKNDGYPTYHLANVVDDHLMKITHVIRGEEWISSTPKHILLYNSFGWELPQFAHLPLLRNTDKSKVSKRKNQVSINYFKDAGFLPEVILNFLGLMAFSFESGKEIFSLEEFIENFTFKRISLGGPVFNIEKLLWMNGKYLREKKTGNEFIAYLQEQLFSNENLSKILPLVKDRIQKSEDFIEHTDFFFKKSVAINPKNCWLNNINDKNILLQTYKILTNSIEQLNPFTTTNLETCLTAFCSENSIEKKNIYMCLREIITGKQSSPPLLETMIAIGHERCIIRLKSLIEELEKTSQETKNTPKNS